MTITTPPILSSEVSETTASPKDLPEAGSTLQPTSPFGTGYPTEVRFAVVMYGGVSLAIYMNGIAQELLRMVRSTAVKKGLGDGDDPCLDARELGGSERVYRKLSYIMAGGEPKNAENDLKSNGKIQTRFIVDIISGSSAGGINGIFLGKALANGQNMDALKDLWVQEGDINLLLNDKKSVEKYLSRQKPPASLLNSQRMYLELLKAFDKMEGKDDRSGKIKIKPTPYVDELDLFVTATDINGLTLPIKLADNVVYERRHRNVFHFIYSESTSSRNDFSGDFNPFLAYAARCTSAFPFAFEPMRLCDIDEVLKKIPAYHSHLDQVNSASSLWNLFFKDYQSSDTNETSAVPFARRSFGDGGYLDNKPFSYATATMARKRADLPVDRKLIYIEPSPEHPEEETESDREPNALENTIAAAIKLPRYETIREDLELVIDRNRSIERVNSIVQGVEEDIGSLMTEEKSLSDEEWAKEDLSFMIKKKGRGYAAYHRLELKSATDDLAELVTRVAGYDEKSDFFVIIRSLIGVWRKKRFTEHLINADDKKTTNRFLHEFGLLYPLRRLNFVMHRFDQLYRLDAKSKEILLLHSKDFWPEDIKELAPKTAKEFRDELLRIKKILNEVYTKLRETVRLLRSRNAPPDKEKAGVKGAVPVSPLYAGVQEIIETIGKALREGLEGKAKSKGDGDLILEYFLGTPGNDNVFMEDSQKRSASTDQKIASCEDRAINFFKEHSSVLGLFDRIGDTLSKPWLEAKEDADRMCKSAFEKQVKSSDPGNGVLTARTCLKNCYEDYDDYDMIIFPIIFGTNIGELDVAEIIRISPEDAGHLIRERDTGCQKLAGTSLSHFGAFLNRSWRENDILWGRLDGAERIIEALLPGHPQAKALIGEAQAAIMLETIEPMGREETKNLLVESLMRPRRGEADGPALSHFIRNLKNNATDDQKAELNQKIKDGEIRDHYLKVFKTRSRLDPQQTMETAARATTIVGDMLSDISAKYNVAQKYVNWIARVGRVAWSLIEVSVPRSIPNLLFRHWLKLLYLFEVVLIVSGTLLLNQTIQQFSLTALAITLATHWTTLILNDFMQHENKIFVVIRALVLALLGLLGVFGLISFIAITEIRASWWDNLTKVNKWFKELSPSGWLSGRSARLGIISFFIVFLLWVIRKDIVDLFEKKENKQK
jgi:patatin-related protein